MLNLIDRAIKLIDRATLIVGSEASWKTKFDLVYNKNLSRVFFDTLDELGIHFEYYDPDMSYEDDVTAFVYAMNSLRPELVSIKTALEGIGTTAEAEDV